MFKNIAGQHQTFFAFDATTNLPKTGDAANITAYVSKDDGAVTVLTDTTATEQDAVNAKGYYIFDLAQAETNGDKLTFTAKSTTANVVVIGVPAVVSTSPPNWSTLFIDSSGAARTTYPLRKNTLFNNFEFSMGADGLTVTGTVSIDGAAPTALTNAVVGIGSGTGLYKINLAAADLNGTVVTLIFAATGVATRKITIPLRS